MHVATQAPSCHTQGAMFVTGRTKMAAMISSHRHRKKHVKARAAIRRVWRLMKGRLTAAMGRHKILGSCKLLALPSKYMSATRGRTPGFHADCVTRCFNPRPISYIGVLTGLYPSCTANCTCWSQAHCLQNAQTAELCLSTIRI